MKEEEELVEKDIQDQSDYEEKRSKPRFMKKFVRMESYRFDGAFEDEVEEEDSCDVPDEKTPHGEEGEKVPYLI
jgi:hypothetical protein